MSLLMDALRRAEAEKKEAAKQIAAEKLSREKSAQTADDSGHTPSEVSADNDEDLGATVKLDRLPLPMAKNSKDGLSSTPNPTANESSEPISEPGEGLGIEDISKSSGDSLDDLSVDFESTSPRMRNEQSQNDKSTSKEPTTGGPQDRSNEKIEATHDFSIHANPDNGEGKQPLTLEPLQETIVTSTEPLPEPILNKSSTLPSAQKPPLSPTNDATLADSEVDPLMISTPGETTLDTSSGQTAVSANTVFEAGSPGISRRIILWTLTLGIALFGLLAVSGVYYFQQAPTARSLPSPIASVELEKARHALEIKTQQANTASVQSFDSKQTNPIPATAGDNDKINPVETSKITSKAPPVDSLPSTDPIAATTMTLDESPTVQTNSEATSIGDDRSYTEPAQKMIARSAPNVDTRRLKIAKSMRGVRSNEQVIAAYRAYRSGDLDTAKLLYEKALSIRPQDINALNGLAALALGDGMQEKAHQLYSKVLKLEPNNPTAAAALFQIEGGAGTRVTESQLKLMLDNGGDSGLINFALGNLYSRHARWNDAQLAFFEAVRHQPENADYLYNLAVSLDQIGQRMPAVDYYQQALTVADNAIAGFSTADVIARIQAIKQSSSNSAP